MAIIRQEAGELYFKIAYCGPTGAGRASNLSKIYEKVEPAQRVGKMVSLTTSSDRTIFFSFCSPQNLWINGYKLVFQVYTVPGQIIHNTTRQLILRGVDGVVFVADSQYEKMAANVECFGTLQEELAKMKPTTRDVSYVLQYNKRDLPGVAPVEYLEFLLNSQEINAPFVEASAALGIGVSETFNAMIGCLLQNFEQRLGVSA